MLSKILNRLLLIPSKTHGEDYSYFRLGNQLGRGPTSELTGRRVTTQPSPVQ